MNPVGVGSKSRMGKPAPIRNEKESEKESPEKILSQMEFRFRGWLTSNSRNSTLLYT
jgi:hypothetical protein